VNCEVGGDRFVISADLNVGSWIGDAAAGEVVSSGRVEEIEVICGEQICHGTIRVNIGIGSVESIVWETFSVDENRDATDSANVIVIEVVETLFNISECNWVGDSREMIGIDQCQRG